MPAAETWNGNSRKPTNILRVTIRQFRLHEAFREHFLPDQVAELAVDWGRYAELLSYDDDKKLLHAWSRLQEITHGRCLLLDLNP